jgi:tetratricopeptide (TPR) repeat protein
VLQGPMISLLGQLQRVEDRNLKEVLALEQAGRWDELTRLADAHLAKSPRIADWWLIKGYAHSELAQHAVAAEAFAEAVRLEPDSAIGWNLLGQSYRAAGEPQRAVNALNGALLALRETTMTLFLLAESYSDLQRYRDAAGAYREVLARDPGFAPAWFGLGRAYGELGEVKRVREVRAQLEQLDPALASRLP